MKKVLLISNYRNSSGGISVVIESIKKIFLSDDKINVKLFNTKGILLYRLIKIVKLFFVGYRFDIFHIHASSFFGFYPAITGIFVGKILNKKIILTFHGGNLEMFLKKYYHFINFFLKKIDLITVPSKYLKNIFTSYNINTTLFPNPIDENNIIYRQRRSLKPNFIVTRSFEKIYNIQNILIAFELVQNKYPNASIKLVGSGSLKNDFLKYVKERKLKNVFFTGRITNKEVCIKLNEADIFLNASLIDNMPISILEAFGSGIPVITSAAGGIKDFASNFENCLICDPNDPSEIYNLILKLLSDIELSIKISDNAYQYFLNFTHSKIKSKYINIYQ